MLINASKLGEFHKHLNDLISSYPDHCPQASDIMLFFLSCVTDADLILHLVKKKVFGTSEENMYVDARKFGEFREYLINHYPNRLPHLLLKGFEGIDLSEWPEKYMEEQRKHDQARLSRKFKIVHKRRFMAVHSSKADSSEMKPKMRFISDKRRESWSKCGTDMLRCSYGWKRMTG